MNPVFTPELVKAVQNAAGMTRDEGHEVCMAILASMSEALDAGKEVSLRGIGRFWKNKVSTSHYYCLKNGSGQTNPDALRIRYRPSDALTSHLNDKPPRGTRRLMRKERLNSDAIQQQ